MYRTSIVSFVDILGFKALVSEYDFENIKAMIDSVRMMGGYYRLPENYKAVENSFSAQVIQFSDSLLRVRRLEIDGTEPEILTFLAEIRDLALLQAQSMTYGICIRGAVTVGDIHIDEQGAFGPAFIHAYELESKVSVFPRIVIDSAFLESVRNHNAGQQNSDTKSDIENKLNKFLKTDQNKTIWIDYLSIALGDLFDQENSDYLLAPHKETILRGLCASSENIRLAPKYQFLAQYHNSFIENHSIYLRHGLGDDYSDLIISDEEMAHACNNQP